MQVNISKVKITDAQSALNGQFADLTIENGIITALKPVTRKKKENTTVTVGNKEVFSSDGDIHVSPGWVDIFADYREPGFEHKETLESGMKAAAAGGFTDVLLLPNTNPVTHTKANIQFIKQRTAGNAVSVHPMGAATQQAEGKDLAEMLDMHTNGARAFTDGWKPVQSANLMLKALEYVKAFNGQIVQMPVDASLAAGTLMNEGVISTELGMAGAPELAETLMLYRDIELLRYTGSRLHVTGISTAAAVAMIRKAKKDKLAITCSVTPYHLALTDHALSSYDSNYKVTPPLRNETDRMALVEALADGTIDCIATHHRPHEWDAKTKEFEYAAEGMAIQESAFNILWDALQHYITPARLAEALGAAPAAIFGLESKTIAKGSAASLTLFATSGQHTLTTDTRRSTAINNPFLGKALAGKVVGIINNKQCVLNK